MFQRRQLQYRSDKSPNHYGRSQRRAAVLIGSLPARIGRDISVVPAGLKADILRIGCKRGVAMLPVQQRVC